MAETARALCRAVTFVPPETTVAKAAQLMTEANIGSVLVGSPQKAEGIFTERDVVRRVVAKGLDPAQTMVKDLMTTGLSTVAADEPMTRVFELLAQGRFRHLPITENGRVVGMASVADMSKVLHELAADQAFLDAFSEELKPD